MMIDRKQQPQATTVDGSPAGAASTLAQDLTLEGPLLESGEVRVEARPSEALPLPGRYDDLGPVARGAFGEVRRVRDTVLDRVLAMKVLHAEVSRIPSIRRRFFTEVQITAQLQHPGIVPVYDHGELRDGRLFYVMKEVRGRTLGAIIAELHAAAPQDAFAPTASGWTFRRVVDAFARIVLAVAYAHDHGILHRDLKPDNLMVGEFGEVLVMDWGLARRVTTEVPREDDGEEGATSSDDSFPSSLTRHGDVLGTPAYMPPEQARGARDLHGTHSDVYALGAILYHLLSGRPPYQGGAATVLRRILEGPPPSLEEGGRGKLKIPPELARACERAMQRDIAGRGTAEALAADALSWLDGARRREEALAVLADAHALAPLIVEQREQAAMADARARELLGALRPFDPVDLKRPAWHLEDEARRLGRAAALAETKWLEAVHGALRIDPDLPEAHAMLADHYRAALLEAERARREEDAVRCEELLRAHDRGRHAAFLRGDGALTLVTDPPGALVIAERFVMRDRRLVTEPYATLGRTPLHEAPLPRGSYLLRLQAPGRAEVRYPVVIERAGHWDGAAPGDSEPFPIALPAIGELDADDVYVPASFCWIGGDPQATDSLPGRRIWIDAFVIRRFPVTCKEYVAFLNDLVAVGREAEATAACPRINKTVAGAGGAQLAFHRDDSGRFMLPPEGDWQEDWPAVLIDWHGASAYTRWLAARTGKPWRLANELEREKAARGVDGRLLPWGDHLDATFACVAEGQEGPASRERVDGHPTDESAYGVRGLAGNVRDWCINVWKHDGPKVEHDRLVVDAAPLDDPDFRVIKGGTWNSAVTHCRAAGRAGGRPDLYRWTVGARAVRSYPR